MKQSDELERAVAQVCGCIEGRTGVLEAARAVVDYQMGAVPVLAAWWRTRGFEGRFDDLDAIPAVPTDVFRHVALRSERDAVAALFRTSGTTLGLRGEHSMASLAAYDLGAVAQWRRWVEPDGLCRRWVGLVPDPASIPDSSLGHMVGVLAEAHGVDRGTFHVKPDALDLEGALDRLAVRETPVVLFSTAFALVELLEALQARGRTLELGPRSVVVETGGFKGRSRTVEAGELRRVASERLGLPPARIVSEYSMTELSSQLYTAIDAPEPNRRLQAPPWCRVTAVDPVTLERLPEGQPGLLRFVDLANVSSAIAVQTLDVGIVHVDGVELQGRAPGAMPRGCSLAIEELLERRPVSGAP